MPRGGARPGAGRKRSTPGDDKAKKASKKVLPESERPAVKDEHWPFGTQPPAEPPKATDLSELTPLDYLLSVMRDLSADEKVRLQAAQLAAPYVHSRPAPGGKKAARQEAAGKASVTSKFAPGAPPKLSMVK